MEPRPLRRLKGRWILLALRRYAGASIVLVIAAVLTLWSMVAYLQVAWPELRGNDSTP